MPRRSFLALTAAGLLTLGLDGSASPAPPPGQFATFDWSEEKPRFGGFSAIEMEADGSGFLALSDRGAWVRARLTRDKGGRISAVDSGPVTLLLAEGTTPLRRSRADSEGMAVSPDGSVHVSFEAVPRVLRYATIDGPAENLPVAPAFRAMQKNGALEALAVTAGGDLIAIPERTGRGDRGSLFARYAGSDDGADFPVFRFRDGAWDQPWTLPRRGAFLPVSADVGPDGRLYVLERAFHGLAGFASRVRSFRIGKALSEERELFTSPPGWHDNLEGLSVWQDRAGALRLTMIADDNFNAFQSTQIVEYRFPG